jgi:hypothetical protein
MHVRVYKHAQQVLEILSINMGRAHYAVNVYSTTVWGALHR